MGPNAKKAGKEETRRKLREALGRIISGTARHVRPSHRISVSSVSSEAGISRTALYRLYPDIVAEIEAAADKSSSPKVSRARRRELEVRAENEELQRQVVALLSQNATLLHRLAQLEKRLAPASHSARVIPLKRDNGRR